MPLEVSILEIARIPTYQKIAPEALTLSRLDMTNRRIARLLKVTDKTVKKALSWAREVKVKTGHWPG